MQNKLIFSFIAVGVLANTQAQIIGTKPGDINSLPGIPEQITQPQQFAQPISQSPYQYSQPAALPKLPDVDIVDKVIKQQLPLEPSDIGKMKNRLDETMREVRKPYLGVAPRPVVSMIDLDFSPGSAPPVIRIAPNHGALINFIDNTGASWEVSAVDNANRSGVDVAIPGGGSAVTVYAKSDYDVNASNIIVFLKDYHIPIVVSVLQKQPVFDARIDMRVPSVGPSPNPVIAPLAKGVTQDQEMANILANTPSKSSIKIPTSPIDVDVWTKGNNIYIRTKNNNSVISPASDSFLSSSDGTTVWRIPYKTPVVLISFDGEIISIDLKVKI